MKLLHFLLGLLARAGEGPLDKVEGLLLKGFAFSFFEVEVEVETGEGDGGCWADGGPGGPIDGETHLHQKQRRDRRCAAPQHSCIRHVARRGVSLLIRGERHRLEVAKMRRGRTEGLLRKEEEKWERFFVFFFSQRDSLSSTAVTLSLLAHAVPPSKSVASPPLALSLVVFPLLL